MNLPDLVIEKVKSNDLMLLKGGCSLFNIVPNNSNGVCSGTNNGTGKCDAENNSSGRCDGPNNGGGLCG